MTVVLMDSGASHSFVAKYMVNSHQWLMAGTKPMPIHLATGNKAFFVFDEYYSHNIL